MEIANEELSTETDKTNKTINEKISELENKITNNNKSTTKNSDNISDIKNTFDKISMKGGEDSSRENSDIIKINNSFKYVTLSSPYIYM